MMEELTLFDYMAIKLTQVDISFRTYV